MNAQVPWAATKPYPRDLNGVFFDENRRPDFPLSQDTWSPMSDQVPAEFLPDNPVDAAERAVLGFCLIDNGSVDVAGNFFAPDDLSMPQYSRIFRAMISLHAQGIAFDPVVLRNEDSAIDSGTLTDLMSEVAGPAYFEPYCQQIAKAAQARRIQDVGLRIVQASNHGDIEAVQNLSKILDSLVAVPEPISGIDLIWERFSDIQEEAIRWHWPDWIAAGKLHLVAGVQGDGKSTVLTAIAALQSRGAMLPDGSMSSVKRVGFLISEDGVADTVLPRLRMHKADLTNIYYLKSVKTDDGERPINLVEDRERIRLFIRQNNLDMLYIDALSDFMGSAKRNDDGEVRAVLTPLSQMANDTGCSIVGIVHLGKPGASARRAVERVLGSGAFTQVARIVWAVSTDPEDESRRYLGQVKNNLAPEVQTIEWHRDRDQPITWDGLAEVSVKSVMSGAHEKTSKIDDARIFLEDFLKGGGKLVRDVMDTGKKRGLGRDSIYKAADEIGVSKDKEAGRKNGPVYWRLPHDSPVTSSGRSVSSESLVTSGSSGSNHGVITDLPELPTVPEPTDGTEDIV